MRVEDIMSTDVAVARPDTHAGEFQHRNAGRGIHIGRSPPADLRSHKPCQQAIEPQIVIEPDAHEEARSLQAQKVLRLGLIVFRVHIAGNEAGGGNAVPAHRLGQTAQIGGRGDDGDRILRASGVREQQAQSGDQRHRCRASPRHAGLSRHLR